MLQMIEFRGENSQLRLSKESGSTVISLITEVKVPAEASIPNKHRAAALQVEWVPIGRLRSNPRNPRTHSKKQKKQLADMIRKFGFNSLIAIDHDETIMCGQRRKRTKAKDAPTQGSPFSKFALLGGVISARHFSNQHLPK